MTNDQCRRIAEAAILESDARRALAESEGKGQRDQAREDRKRVSEAERALAALIAEAKAGA